MTELSMSDVAASFLGKVIEDPNGHVGEHSKKLFYSANVLARKLDAQDFVALADQMDVVQLAKFAELSFETFEVAFMKRDFDTAGVLACINLMALNLVDGLSKNDESKEIVEMSATLYATQYAIHARELAYLTILNGN